MKSRVVILSGGIGGAKLALGLYRTLPADTLTVVVNTGDDFRHLGLAISPDIDTLVYTLADLADPQRGWGRRDETWSFMAALSTLGGPQWFQLGDGDLAMHVERTHRLADGETLSAVTADIARRLGVRATVLPMSDATVRTRLRTDTGWLDFQDYFVGRRCEPAVSEIRFDGAADAAAAPGVLAALADPDLRAVVIAPSNPYVSIDPILAVPSLRDALADTAAPIVAVSPIIGGAAVKGPTAKMMRELGATASAAEVARRYAGLIDGFVVDTVDADAELPGGMRRIVAPTLMTSLEDRERLARTVLAAAQTCPRIRPATGRGA
ncbi:2-phospho-L-lactate transferase [Azospirillum argentinense]|uniref:2-phospho-L-lactate transferase n=1 Tax=Azospirillum brasilense TaxID=192 RepID=A0A4D8QC50_AZOBR|nr:2-phospho-L-lactate transferase [Azospirillum argentinense]QCO03692.1 2-phospho-L-lactate transferase [Azospirillum argentinense]